MNNPERILIIESDPAFGGAMDKALKNIGYNTTLITTGSQGMDFVREFTPKLVILDVTLSDSDSYDFLARKSNEPTIAKIPVFLISSQGVPINMRKVPPGSVAEFMMAFHSNPDDIIDKVNRLFGREAVSAPSAGANSSSPKKKVLWVEDDKLIGTILAKKLVSSGFDLFHSKTGEEALESLKQAIPDVIVLDLLLPGMSGFDILTHINADPGLKNVPVMILSNLSKPSDIERAKTLGAKRFLIKAASSLEDIVREVRALCQ